MPDVIRARGGSRHPRRRRFRKSVLAAIPALAPATAALADDRTGSIAAAYPAAFAALERLEIAGLALTLGVIFFAVVTAIALVRTRARAVRADADARVEIIALKDEVDRA